MRLALVVALVLATLGAVVFTLVFLRRNTERMTQFHVPKILNLRVEEMLVLPGGGIRPIQVPTGVPVRVECDVTPPDDPAVQTQFVLLLDYRPLASHGDCLIDRPIPGEPGSQHVLTLEYQLVRPGRPPLTYSSQSARIELRPATPFVRIHTLVAPPDRRPLQTLTVPARVLPYVDGAFALPGKTEDYVALFFVDPEGRGQPVLQVVIPPEDPRHFRVNAAPLKRYRRFGPGLSGYAAWPSEPIQVGNLEDERQRHDLYVGIFRQQDVAQVAARFLRLAGVSASGEVQLQVLTPSLEDVRSLAFHGLLSPPLSVVRAERAPTETKSVWRAVH